MRYAVAFSTVIFGMFWPGASAAQMQLQPLANNVYAVIQPTDQRFEDSNSLLIVTTEGVVVVDAQARRDNVLRVMEFAGQVSDLPVVMVINTHWHPDHTQGNALYRQRYGDSLTIVGHDLLFEDLPARAAPAVARDVERVAARIASGRAALAGGVTAGGQPLSADERAAWQTEVATLERWLDEHRGARFLTPTLSYDDFMRLQIGDMRIHLIHFRAHTGGDTVVWLPAQKIMASGDVLDDLPYVGDGYPRSWIDALNDIDIMNARYIVPGHGPVLRDEQRLDDVRAYLAALRRAVAALKAQDATLEQARETLRLPAARSRLAADEPYAQGLFDAILGDAIESVWRELDEPPQP